VRSSAAPLSNVRGRREMERWGLRLVLYLDVCVFVLYLLVYVCMCVYVCALCTSAVKPVRPRISYEYLYIFKYTFPSVPVSP